MHRWWRSRRRNKIFVSVAAVLILWLGLFTKLLVFPSVDHPQHVDAIVVLGPPGQQRLDKAVQLLHDGVSTNLVISINSYKQRPAQRLCNTPPPTVTVSCFTPNPATTLGEGQQLQKLIEQHHWRSIAIVTSPYHVTRARWILQRCDKAQLNLVSSNEDVAVTQWAYQYLYQTAGFVKAFFNADC